MIWSDQLLKNMGRVVKQANPRQKTWPEVKKSAFANCSVLWFIYRSLLSQVKHLNKKPLFFRVHTNTGIHNSGNFQWVSFLYSLLVSTHFFKGKMGNLSLFEKKNEFSKNFWEHLRTEHIFRLGHMKDL